MQNDGRSFKIKMQNCTGISVENGNLKVLKNTHNDYFYFDSYNAFIDNIHYIELKLDNNHCASCMISGVDISSVNIENIVFGNPTEVGNAQFMFTVVLEMGKEIETPAIRTVNTFKLYSPLEFGSLTEIVSQYSEIECLTIYYNSIESGIISFGLFD